MRHWLIALMLCLAALLTGVVRPSSATEIDATADRKLYAAKCAGCHKLYDPSQYEGEKWEYWMRKMKRKARLREEQYQQLTGYLQTLRPAK